MLSGTFLPGLPPAAYQGAASVAHEQRGLRLALLHHLTDGGITHRLPCGIMPEAARAPQNRSGYPRGDFDRYFFCFEL